MTTNYWNYTKGESVPSGGANQLNTAASQGSNLGNWLSKYKENISSYKEKYGILGIVLIVVAVILLIRLITKKHRKSC